MRKHVNVAMECGFLLFLVGAAVAVFWLWRDDSLRGIPALLTIAVPAGASLLLIAASIFTPALFSVDELRYPLNVTLPIVHTALVLTTLVLISSSRSSIERIPDQFRVVYLWAEARALGPALVLGVLVLTLASLAMRVERE